MRGLPIDLEGIYKWIVFVPSRSSPRIGVPNRYFGARQDGKLKVRGIEMRRHDCPAIVSAMQQEILDVLSQAADASEYRRLAATRGAEILEKYLARVRDGALDAADLAIRTSLSKAPEQYRHATRAAAAAQSLAARGVHLRPGENISYILTDIGSPIPSERARPIQMAQEDLLYDQQEYTRLLRQAFEPFQQPFQANVPTTQRRAVAPAPCYLLCG
jgi:DNA polymerase-2